MSAPLAFQDVLAEYREIVEEVLDQSLPQDDEAPSEIHEAMRFSVFGKAKRLRPALAMGVAAGFGEDPRRVAQVAAAIELIHTYSLIHDDLPCMDDDDLRRGRPTVHVQYSEAIAVLAGDALLTAAFELILANGSAQGYPPPVLLEVILELSRSAGSRGMISGQVEDLRGEGRELTLAELENIHALKTGRLFTASVRIGAHLAKASDEDFQVLTRYSEGFGKVFQIVDDILDVVGETQELGKPVGSDEKNQKATYPRILGLEESRRQAQALADAARQELAALSVAQPFLEGALRYLLERTS